MSKRIRHDLDHVWNHLEPYFSDDIRINFLKELSKTFTFDDPIVPVSVFEIEDPGVCPLLTVQGPYVHCSILKAALEGQQQAIVKENNTLRYIYDMKETSVNGKAIKFYPENPEYFSVLQTVDKQPVGVQTIYDRYGRVCRQFHQGDILGPGSYKQVIAYEYDTDEVHTIMDCIPRNTYIGEMKNYEYAGTGSLYQRNELKTFYLHKKGFFLNNVLTSGKSYYPNQNIAFDGTFVHGLHAEGTAYHMNGRISWKGQFDSGLPQGIGVGFLTDTMYFEGLMEKGLIQNGTIYRNTKGGLKVVSTGSYDKGQLHGYGKLYTETRCFEGYFTNGIPTIALETPYGDHSNLGLPYRFDHMPPMRYCGAYNSKRVWHGQGAMIFHINDYNDNVHYVKFVGQFVNGKRNGCFKIYEVPNDVLEGPTESTMVPNYHSGVLLGTVLFENDNCLNAIQIYQDTKHVYSGKGHTYLYGSFEDIFVRDGRGTAFCNGKPAYDAIFDDNIIQVVVRLYDEDARLLFENTDEEEEVFAVSGFIDSAFRWPKLNSTGIIYSAKGTPMYQAVFENNILLKPDLIIQSLPVVHIPWTDTMVDYITLTSIPKDSYAITFNDEELQFKNFITIETFIKLAEDSLKDPLKGSFPGYRITRVKLE